jgi:glycosyltransferase involved in cell wall biosynthesis
MNLALYHNLTSGGSKREAYEFAKQFVAHGHTFDLYHPRAADEDFLPLTHLARQTYVYDLQTAAPFDGRLPLLRKYVDLYRLKKNLDASRALAFHIAQEIDAREYDFVFLHHDQPVQSPYLLNFLQTPSVYYCAEPMREFYEPPIPRPYTEPQTRAERWQKKWYAPQRALRRRLIQTADARNVRAAKLLLTNSFFSAESIYRAYGLRARVVYLGVDAETFRPLDVPRENFVLSVGAISPLKGYDFLLEALSHVPEPLRPELVLVGNTASQGETLYLQKLAGARHVTLRFRVNVREDELVQLYNRARALVYAPILEPFGFAPLEAMACETPVVAVREGGVRESVREGETGLLVERDAQDFAHALTRILDNRTLARCLGERGRQYVLEFWTWQAAFQRMLDAIAARGWSN